jgi:hypothetical protein
VTLTGTGTAGPTISLSPTTINFGNLADGTTSAKVPITVTNTGSSTVTFSSIAVTGTNSANFAQTNNCGTSLTQGNACTINVTFSPSTAGSYTAAVTLTDNAANNPQSVGLSGTGVAPVTLSASSIAFGTVLVGTNKVAAPVTLTNKMNVALTGITVAASGTGFTQVNTCGTSIAAGGTCTITATFTPNAAGAATGAVTITDSANNSPQSITLTGTGALPVALNPTSLNFGTVKVGTTSAAKTVNVTNNMKTTLTITAIGFNGPDAADYSQTNTCGTSLAAAAKCTISVTFKPKATGSRPANLILTDSATTSPQKVKIIGTGN